MGKIVVKVNKKRLINEFIQLIKISSPSESEREISDFLKKKLTRLGLNVIEDSNHQKTNDSSRNLICHLNGDQSITPILFTAHMDTISVEKEIKPHIRDNYIM